MTAARWLRIHAVVRRIPRGRVATYGQVASLAGLPGQARQVGYALHALPSSSTVPWHRVVNAAGAVSVPGSAGVTQRLLLAAEGVPLDARGRVALAAWQWKPRRIAARRA
ncbi:MAG: MGMT family protein [Gemmatimonadales bacterium]|jgi:methylated-DNA-protein-cysteine methyltransferase-like protein|nr:MGMT family protein [Gemmatimonadales bacterium]